MGPVLRQVMRMLQVEHAMIEKRHQATVQAVPFKVNAVTAALVPFQEPLKPGADESD